MNSVPLAEAQAKFVEIVRGLSNGEEVSVVEGEEVIAKIVGGRRSPGKRPGPGLCRGMIEIIADDDEHLKDFAEYMP